MTDLPLDSNKPDKQPVDIVAKRSQGAIKLSWTIAYLTAATIVLTVLPLYIGNEAPYYWSDFNYYEWATRQSLISMLSSPITYPLLLLCSAFLTHNLFFTAPLVLMMLVLGDTRLGFVESVSLLYFLPFVILLARLGAELCQSQPGKRWPFILTATCLMVPPLWAPLLRGYPDYCAALALVWCVHLYFQNRSLTSLRAKLKIGFFLALAVLLRRYFAYEAIAFVIAMVADQILLKKEESKVAFTHAVLKDSFISMLEIGAMGATTVIALGFPFLINVTKHNYHALYESYHVSLLDSLTYFYQAFGPVLLLLSAAGYILLARMDLFNQRNLRFVLMFYGLGAAFWLLGPNELGTHYTLYFTPLVAIGLMSLVLALPRFNKLLALAAVLPLTAYCLFNLYLSAMPVKLLEKTGIMPAVPAMLSYGGLPANFAGSFFSANYGPWQRTDRMALHNIVTDMRAAILANQDSNLPATMAQFSLNERRGLVYVAATSNLLTGEVLRNAERELYGKFGDIIAWAELPCVDSKDSYALERLLGASYLVLPDKPQFFIAPDQEDILTAILRCFKDKWPLAEDFKQCAAVSPQVLDDGVTATVYERIRPTSIRTAALTLGRMRDFIKERPGSQPQWISTGTLSEICYDLKRRDFVFRLNAPRERSLEGEQRYLLYSDALPETFVLEGTIVKNAVPTDLAIECIQLDGEGNQIVSQQIALTGERTKIKLELDRGRTAYLALVLDRAANVEDGTIIFDNMQIQPR